MSIEVENYTGDTESKEYKALLRKQKRQLDKCGVYIVRMVLGLANNGKFSGYTWRDEMIADALLQCNKALIGRKYDFDRGFNIFSYFNRVAWREFIHRIKVEKKKVELHKEYIEEHAKDYAEGCEEQVRFKPHFASSLGEFYDVECETTYNDKDENE